MWPASIFEEEVRNLDPKRPGEALQDEGDAEFIDFGNSAPREPDFISEEEDERPSEAETEMGDVEQMLAELDRMKP
ncbi:hypothetical protein GMJLKIPL_2842 [Methylobacterium isbiliense]|uniref:Uncharacterized protein n=1 Tax=Methylobacterium isbiliense TaxID=315478 RepID=A0ABQ4SCL8_9HYPH|nr:hypothetical protein GMJLKIPL_2842 [Methylobacterium isbiliense]